MAVDKSQARVRRMFGEIAPRYDRLNHLLSMNIDRYWRWQTVRRVRPSGGRPLLDVCTGTGDLALAYARRTGAPVVAADFCPEMLSVGRGKAQAAGVADRVTFVEADAQNLPFVDGYFQIVSVAFGLRNVSDTDRGLHEMVRVCRSGGQVAILEFTTPRTWPIRPLYGWYFRRILPRIGQSLAPNGASAYDYLPQSVGEFPCYEALAERMERAGLSDVYFTPLSFGVATLYVGTKPMPISSGDLPAYLSSEPIPTPEAAVQ